MTQPNTPAKPAANSSRNQQGTRRPDLSRRTHPRSARAHRRALRRVFREALRRALSRGGIALFAGVLTAGSTQPINGANVIPDRCPNPLSLYEVELN